MDIQKVEQSVLTVAEVLDKVGGFVKKGSHLIKALVLCGTGNDSLDFFRARLSEIYAETKKDCEAAKLIKIVENHPHCPAERWEGPLMRAKSLAGVEFDLPISHVQNMAIKPKTGNNIEDVIAGGGFADDFDDDETLDLPPVKRPESEKSLDVNEPPESGLGE